MLRVHAPDERIGMVDIKRVEVIPASEMFVTKARGYLFGVYPAETVRIHFALSSSEQRTFLKNRRDHPGDKAAQQLGAVSCAWDTCKDTTHDTLVVYSITRNPFGTTAPHTIAVKAKETLTRWLQTSSVS